MKELLREFLSYILVSEAKSTSSQTKGTDLKFIRGSRKYWSPSGKAPATHTKDASGNIVPISMGDPDLPKPKADKQAAGVKSKRSAPAKKGVKGAQGVKLKKGTAASAAPKPPAAPKTPSAESEQGFIDPNPKTQAVKVGGTDPIRANDIMEDIFSGSTIIELGPDKVKTGVRNIIDPTTKKPIDVTTPKGRTRAVAILNDRLEKFRANGKIDEVCTALADSSTPTGERTALRKWLGNLGELGGLRDMLAAGNEAYLYSDSNPKNDIVALIDCNDGEENTRDIRLAAISTKSTSGKAVGRIDASALVYIMDSVAGKMIPMQGRKQQKNFKAENVAQCLFGMQKRIYSSTTRGDVVRGNRFGGSERKIEVSSDRKQYYDPEMLAKAERENREAKTPKDPGGQRSLMAARKIKTEEVLELFSNEENPTYKQLHKDMTKIMDGNADGAKMLIGLMRSRLERRVQNSQDFRLTDFDEWMTDEIANLIDSKHQDTGEPSELLFQSDMMISTFDAKKGYVGCAMVNGDTMTERVREKYGEMKDMSTKDKLKNILGWKNNPRGMGLETAEGGYIDPQQRAVPPLKMLKKTDFKAMKQYTTDVCKD